jgi:hypothetical protein
MSNPRWRERRETYLRESGRTADLIREEFVKSGLTLIEGGGRRHRLRKRRPALVILNVPRATEACDGSAVPVLTDGQNPPT